MEPYTGEFCIAFANGMNIDSYNVASYVAYHTYICTC